MSPVPCSRHACPLDIGSLVIGVVACWLMPARDNAWAQFDSSQTSAERRRDKPAEPHGLAELKTVAESSEYLATANGSDTELFLKRLHRLWPNTHLETLGHTVEGRAIWGLVVPPTALASKPLTVLLLGGIHSGECDGKEALLALARDYAGGQHPSAHDSLRLIFVPNFNADGNERIGKQHRPGQAGPEAGMGIRENAQGLDLNRDFVKLESPEVQTLVAALHKYDVDVLIDTHTTNGSLHRYDLTYAVANNPAAPRAVDSWLRTQMLPSVSERLERAGLATFYYGNFEEQHTAWKSFGHEPRYSTELMGMRGKVGILAESYSYASYERRIAATYAFVNEVLEQLHEHSAEVRELLEAAANDTGPDKSLAVQAELAQTETNVVTRGYRQPNGELPKPPYSALSATDHQPHDYRVELWASSVPKHEIKLPDAYCVPAQYAWALSRLAMQGIQLERLSAEVHGVPCEAYVIEKVDKGTQLQNHTLQRLYVRAEAHAGSLPADSYLVRTTQPLGKLAAYLLEPESEDGLAAWNFFDPDLSEEARYPVIRVLAEIPSTQSVAIKDVEATERITFDHIMRPSRSVEYATTSSSSASWLPKSSELVLRRDRQWLTVDPATGSSQPSELMKSMLDAFAALDAFESPGSLERLSPSILSADKKYGLVAQQGDLFLYDAQAGSARQLTVSPKETEELAELSPTGNHVAFVRDNDLYVIDCKSGAQRRLTNDGSTELLNGILDWVYQEEIYGRGQFRAFWFSPDGKRLAFLQLDQTPVMHYQVPDSIHFRQELEDTRYPKAGDPLPLARMWVANIDDGQLREVDLSSCPAEDRLVVRVTWSPSNELWLQIQNRIQTEQFILRVDPTSGTSRRVLAEKSPGWIEILGQPSFLPDGDFLWLSDLPEGRRHLHRFDLQSNQLKQLSRGAWDVAEIVAVSPDGKTAYVTGNRSHPTETQLISVDTQAGKTVQITREPGVHRTRLSHDCKYVIDSWSSLKEAPRTLLRSLDGQIQRVLAAPVIDRYRYVAMAAPQLTTIRARDGLDLQTLIMLPPHIANGSRAEKVPVLFHVYGGPQAPTVQNIWQSGNYWWHQYLCSQGYAVVLCDNRSARGRGIADTWKIHRDMGRVELKDLEDAVQWVSAQPWADKQRIGVWGWSYGGYFTAYALTHSQSFKAGIAGAPVTDWRNYDAIYTERYMDLPKNNEAGYKSSSAVTAADQLHGRLLLIHGERDDNVHLSNTLQMAHALQKAGKPFDMMIYPKNRHGIVEPSQRYHLYQTMTEFLERNLKN